MVLHITTSGGGPRGVEAASALDGLTPMQARVAELLAAGRSVGETAEELGNAEATPRGHLARIFSKTGTTRQGELVALAARLLLPVSRALFLAFLSRGACINQTKTYII